MEKEIQELVSAFTASLSSLVERSFAERTRRAMEASFGYALVAEAAPSRLGLASVPIAKSRKKPPRQLCPVPGCKNTAAPIFGMVCKKHKDVPKAKIKEYREARKAKKTKKRR